MTNKETLEKAIHKAIDGGYDEFLGKSTIDYLNRNIIDLDSEEGKLTIRGFLTDHKFCRALWGEEFGTMETDFRSESVGVYIAEDPLEYLEEYAL